MARDLFQMLGLSVDFQVMDWGTVVTRRSTQNPTDKGGWSAFITALDGVTVSNPGGATSRCGAAAIKPGLAGQWMKNWNHYAMPVSTPRTSGRKKRSPSKSRFAA